ncbi:MAG: hypothetical protein LC749_04640 [Actinobacteria bacterium]|nr:hypothetical protein [Actinomycetota bacterium]
MKDVVLLLVMAVMTLALGGAVLAMRSSDQRRRDGDRVAVRVHFPKELDPEAVVAFLRAMASLERTSRPLSGRSSVAFEMIATPGMIEHRLRVPSRRLDFVLAQLRAAVPAIGTEVLDRNTIPVAITTGAELRLTGDRRPLRTDEPAAVSAALLAAVQPLQAGEVAVLQWIICPTHHRPLLKPAVGKNKANATPSLLDVAHWQEQTAVTAKEHRDKTAEPAFSVVGRIGATSGLLSRSTALVQRLVAMQRLVQRPGVALVRRWRPTPWV